MQANFVFQIRSISLSEGFEINCAGLLDHPLRIRRLFEALAAAVHLGRNLDGEIQIFDVAGDVVEVLPLPNSTLDPLMKVAA